MSSRPRTLVVAPYWSFFESATSTDLRGDRARLLASAALAIEACGHEVVDAVLLESQDDSVALVRRWCDERIGTLVVLSSMVCPPAPTLSLIAGLPSASVVLWPSAWSAETLVEFDHAAIVERGATVGTPMISAMLVRSGRPFSVLPLEVPVEQASAELAAHLAAAAAAATVRSARVGRVGDVLAGYASVDLPDDTLHSQLGVAVVRIPATDLADRYAVVHASAIEAEVDELIGADDTDVEVSQVRRAVAAAAALSGLVAEHGLDAATVNCHCDALRFSDRFGFAPCFALGESTSRGVPWTCTGDVLTAIAMLVASEVAGSSLYHEIEAYDPQRDDFVLANSGEHDRRWTSSQVTVRPNPWWASSVCATHDVDPGPATLVALTYAGSRIRLVAGEGDVTAASESATGTVSCRFRWSGGGVDGWTAWVEAGAGHHSALARGHVAAVIADVARHLGIDYRRA